MDATDDKLLEAYRQYAAWALEHADKVMSLPWWVVLILGAVIWLYIEYIVVPDFANTTHLKGLGKVLDDSDSLIALFFITAAIFSWILNNK